MDFFFKKRSIVVDAFTYNPSAYRYFPIDTANNFIPEWWTRVNKNITIPGTDSKPPIVGNTIRRCAGVIEYYNKSSLVIPLWTDLRVETGPEGFKYIAADCMTKMAHHSQDMRGKEYLPQYEHFKIASPWKFQEKSGVKFHFSQCFYNFEDPRNLLIPPGVVNYKFQHSTEINFFAKRPASNSLIDLEAGQPLILLQPLSEKPIEVRTHMISEEEYNQKFHWVFAFNNPYQKAKKIMSGRKCPFH